jgi:hypothetical protein
MDEMVQALGEIPDCIKNTVEIVEKCNVELEFNKLHLPRFEPPRGPDKSTLCPPAAAISKARLANSCPATSFISNILFGFLNKFSLSLYSIGEMIFTPNKCSRSCFENWRDIASVQG